MTSFAFTASLQVAESQTTSVQYAAAQGSEYVNLYPFYSARTGEPFRHALELSSEQID